MSDTPTAPTSLRAAPRLARLPAISPCATARMREFHRFAPLQRDVAGAVWRLCWAAAPASASAPSATLQLRIGGAAVSVGVVDAGPFAAIGQALRPELPAALRVAYLGGCGATLWGALESLVGLAVTLEDVQDGSSEHDTHGLGFELRREAGGPLFRGVVHAADPAAWQMLREACERVMPRRPPPADLPIRWAAVVGSTALDAREAAALEADDIVLVDDAQCGTEALRCRLVAGAGRRHAGRVALQPAGLQLIDFDRRGDANMDSTTTQPAPGGEAGFDAIQVNLHFEIARWHAPLAELASLAPGALIDIGRDLDEPVVSVWADERCIGRGQLVAIGDRLGVRLLSVFGQGLPGASGAGEPLHAAALPTVVLARPAPLDSLATGQAG